MCPPLKRQERFARAASFNHFLVPTKRSGLSIEKTSNVVVNSLERLAAQIRDVRFVKGLFFAMADDRTAAGERA